MRTEDRLLAVGCIYRCPPTAAVSPDDDAIIPVLFILGNLWPLPLLRTELESLASGRQSIGIPCSCSTDRTATDSTQVANTASMPLCRSYSVEGDRVRVTEVSCPNASSSYNSMTDSAWLDSAGNRDHSGEVVTSDATGHCRPKRQRLRLANATSPLSDLNASVLPGMR